MNELSTKTFSLAPKNLTEAMSFADMLSKSSVVPAAYKNKPGDIVAAIQLGAEVGLQPMQALRNIAVIKERPCLWGDSLLALVQSHPAYEWIKETDDGDCATCVIKRKGSPEHTVTFSMEDAKNAGLLNKKGAWTQYPKRMRQMRARGFALRDQFADALMGLMPAEEVQDYQIKNVTPKKDIRYTKRGDTDNMTLENFVRINCDDALSDIESAPSKVDDNGIEVMASNEQIERFMELHGELKLTDDVIAKVLKAAGVREIIDMPADKMQKWIDSLSKKLEEKE